MGSERKTLETLQTLTVVTTFPALPLSGELSDAWNPLGELAAKNFKRRFAARPIRAMLCINMTSEQ